MVRDTEGLDASRLMPETKSGGACNVWWPGAGSTYGTPPLPPPSRDLPQCASLTAAPSTEAAWRSSTRGPGKQSAACLAAHSRRLCASTSVHSRARPIKALQHRGMPADTQEPSVPRLRPTGAACVTTAGTMQQPQWCAASWDCPQAPRGPTQVRTLTCTSLSQRAMPGFPACCSARHMPGGGEWKGCRGNTPWALAGCAGAAFGQSLGPIWLANVACGGSEARLADCGHGAWGTSNCSHFE
jgi:hypothetical protein